MLVGPDREKFSLHKDLVCGVSKYFQTAFNIKSERGVEPTITLEDVDVTHFKTFADWLYDEDSLEFVLSSHGEEDHFGKILALFQLGERFGSTTLKQLLVDRIVSYIKTAREVHLDFSKVNELYSKTKAGSGIRRLMVDYIAWEADDKSIESTCIMDWIPRQPELVGDLLLAYIRSSKSELPLAEWEKALSSRDYYDTEWSE